MDKLKYLKTFMLVVEQESFVKAAEQLFITKAAASKQITELEAYFKVQLLQRTTRKVKPTAAGLMFYDYIEKIFAAVNLAENNLVQMQHDAVGSVRITSHRYFGEKYIVPHLKEFLKLYPEIKIDLELADRFPDMEREQIDILCGVGREGPPNLIRKRLLSAHHILCASPKYLEKYGVPRKPSKLINHRYITHSFRDPDNVLYFKNGEKIIVDYQIRINDAMAMVQCALNGLGIVKIYNYFAADYLMNKKLVEILREYREPRKIIYLYYQPQKYLQRKIRLFIDFLCKKVRPKEEMF